MTTNVTRRSVLIGAGSAVAALALDTGAAQATTVQAHGVTPLLHTHAHNDYEHARPLFDALRHGFTSIEADVWLAQGELYIGHLAPDYSRTLRSLYLDPLADLVRRNHGHVYPGSRANVQLLIDVKTDGDAAWPVIHQQLSEYRAMMTVWRSGRRHDGAVTAVLSGELAQRTSDLKVRYAGFDGRLTTLLPAGATPAQLPLLSDNWASLFSWNGIGPMPSDQRDTLRSLVRTAHRGGYRVRFWNTWDVPGTQRDNLWGELLDADVDYLNTDDLAGLQEFLLARI